MGGQANVLRGIRHFGPRGQLVYVHFRDVQGTGDQFAECFIGEGNLDVTAVMRAAEGGRLHRRAHRRPRAGHGRRRGLERARAGLRDRLPDGSPAGGRGPDVAAAPAGTAHGGATGPAEAHGRQPDRRATERRRARSWRCRLGGRPGPRPTPGRPTSAIGPAAPAARWWGRAPRRVCSTGRSALRRRAAAPASPRREADAKSRACSVRRYPSRQAAQAAEGRPPLPRGDLKVAPSERMLRAAKPGVAGMTTTTVNDVHARINATRVRRIVRPDGVEAVQAAIQAARTEGRPSASPAAGTRWAASSSRPTRVLLDMRGHGPRAGRSTRSAAIVEVEAGIQWPALVERPARDAGRAGAPVGHRPEADRRRPPQPRRRARRQRPRPRPDAAADRRRRRVVHARRRRRATSARCSRSGERRALPPGHRRLRAVRRRRRRDGCGCAPRRKVAARRRGRSTSTTCWRPSSERIADGFLYGDFQFAIDDRGRRLPARGVFSCYQPVADDTPIPAGQRALSDEAWQTLLELAHVDKRRARRRLHAPTTSPPPARSTGPTPTS